MRGAAASGVIGVEGERVAGVPDQAELGGDEIKTVAAVIRDIEPAIDPARGSGGVVIGVRFAA